MDSQPQASSPTAARAYVRAAHAQHLTEVLTARHLAQMTTPVRCSDGKVAVELAPEQIARGVQASYGLARSDNAPQDLYGYLMQGAYIAAGESQCAPLGTLLLKHSIGRVWGVCKQALHVPTLEDMAALANATPAPPILPPLPGWCVYVALADGKVPSSSLNGGEGGLIRGVYAVRDRLTPAYIQAGTDEAARATRALYHDAVHLLVDVRTAASGDVVRTTVLFTVPLLATWEETAEAFAAQHQQGWEEAHPGEPNPVPPAFALTLLRIVCAAARAYHHRHPAALPTNPRIEQRTVQGKRSLARHPPKTPLTLTAVTQGDFAAAMRVE